MGKLDLIAAAARQLGRPTADVPEAPLMDVALFALKTHNGIITIYNSTTGQHKTFRCHTAKTGALAGRRVVSVLVSPNLETFGRWQAFGFVQDDGRIALWRKYRGTELASYPKLLERPAAFMAKHGLEYLVEGRCRICDLRLTDAESIKAGVGPVCGGRRPR